MFNSVSNTLITLLMSLLVGQVLAQLWNWGFVNATFDPALTAPDVRSSGASWGVIWARAETAADRTARPSTYMARLIGRRNGVGFVGTHLHCHTSFN